MTWHGSRQKMVLMLTMAMMVMAMVMMMMVKMVMMMMGLVGGMAKGGAGSFALLFWIPAPLTPYSTLAP